MKKKKHRKIWHVVLSVLGILILLVVVAVFGFRTRTVEVEGNSYYSDNTISTWVQNDKFSVNTLYILFKYNYLDPDLPSGVEKLNVSLKDPWTVRVKVEEKEMLGYVDYDGAYLFFDETGTAVIKSKKMIKGTPYIEGLTFDESKTEIGKILPVEDSSIFDRIVDLSKYLREYKLTPDRISCTDGEIGIYFGGVEVLLGTGNYEEKLRQVDPILEKLNELYPDTAGTLHLENYNSDSESIRFVPAK